MQVTSTQLNINTKRDDSGELSRLFVFGGFSNLLSDWLWTDDKYILDDFIIIESTRELLYAYGVISVFSIVLIKFVFQPWKRKKSEKDINVY